MFEFKFGCTRIVILTKRWALKFPMFGSWSLFLQGLLGNCHEYHWWKWTNHDVRLCPVKFYVPTGVLLVMPRAKMITTSQMPDLEELSGLPTDYKTENFGLLAGRVVMIDYGS